MNKKEKFENFLESLKKGKNDAMIESIKKGFNICFEAEEVEGEPKRPMNEIFFPSQYKKALLSKTKNCTIRIGAEIEKYKVGKIYSVKSYAGRSWNIKIKILKISPTTLGELSKFGIPERSIKATKKKEKISLNEKVELIQFKMV